MRKSITLDLNSPVIPYIAGIIATFMFLFYEETKSVVFFLAGMVIMLFAMVFKFENLFLFCVVLYPSIDIIKFGESSAALFGYYMLVVLAKYILTNKVKLNYPIILHACFAVITAFIYSQTSIVTSVIRVIALITLLTSMFRENSKYMNKDYIYKVLIASGIGVVASSIGIILDLKYSRNYPIVMFSCVAAIILLLSIYTKKSNLSSTLQIVIIIGGIIWSLSRTATLSLLVILLVPICLFAVKGKRIAILKIAVVVLVALLLVSILFAGEIEELIGRFNEESLEGGNGRFELWGYYIEKWTSTPTRFLFGNGYNTIYVESGEAKAEHNTIIQMLSTTGFLGTFTLLIVYFLMYKQICGGDGKAKLHYFTPFLCAMVCYLGISSLYADDFHFTLLISFLAIRYLKEINKEPEKENKVENPEAEAEQSEETEVIPA